MEFVQSASEITIGDEDLLLSAISKFNYVLTGSASRLVTADLMFVILLILRLQYFGLHDLR